MVVKLWSPAVWAGAPVDGGEGAKMPNEPHGTREAMLTNVDLPRRSWLKNGNPPGDLRKAKRCGAKTRRQTKCQAPAMKNGRCRMHGGASTGPRTPEGLARSRRANWKHGLYSMQAKAERQSLRRLLED